MYRSGGRVVKSEVFFDELIDGRTKELKPVHGHNVGITRDKLSVLPRLLESPDGIEGMVESASRDYDFFLARNCGVLESRRPMSNRSILMRECMPLVRCAASAL